MNRVVLAGVPFSDNYGDYLISLALQRAFGECCISVDVLDIAGRYDFSMRKKVGLKTRIMRSKNSYILYLATVLNALWVVFKNAGAWFSMIKRSDMLLIGGGNLISDVYLNFPIKIFSLAILCRLAGKKYGIVYVGVAKDMSWFARLLFQFVIKNSQYLSVRDESSKESLLRIFIVERPVVVSFDPAITLQKDLSPDGNESSLGNEMVVAINVVDPSALAKHSDFDCAIGESDYVLCIKEIASSVEGQGYVPVLYTNGADEDNTFLLKSFSDFDVRKCAVSSVRELEDVISSSCHVFATRLHSSILAYAYGISFSVMNWDSKVESFVCSCVEDNSVLFPFDHSGFKSLGYEVVERRIYIANLIQISREIHVKNWQFDFIEMIEKLKV